MILLDSGARSRFCPGARGGSRRRPGAGLFLMLAGLAAAPVEAAGQPIVPPEGDELPKVRTKRFAIYYDVDGSSGPLTSVDLWYTRDNGETWHNYGEDPDRVSPFDFIAPKEGLYGYYLIVKSAGGASADPPTTGTRPQLWAFVDYTPPVLQLHFARFEKDDPATRRIQIRWTGFDPFPEKRPITLRFKRSADTTWHKLIGPMPNVGGYDWPVPEKLRGDVSLKLAFQDRAGNRVERITESLYVPPARPDPVPASGPATAALPPPADRTRPDAYKAAATQPTLAQLRKAEALFNRGGYHRLRGEYDLARERFKEALELDPRNLESRIELAGIRMLEKDYDGAIRWYESLLKDHPGSRDARYGLALAYWHKRQYAEVRDQLEMILAGNASDVQARLKFGDAFWQLGDGVQARRHWRMVTEDGQASEPLVKKAEARLRSFLLAGSEP